MAEAPNRWKLGLFVLAGVGVALGALVWLGASQWGDDRGSLDVVTYFEESVQGLEVGSPVKFRGVSLGSVERIGIVGDCAQIEVRMRLSARRFEELGIPSDVDGERLERWRRQGHIGPPGLRAQLASAGITGVKYIQLDLYDPQKFPMPQLDFEPSGHYVASLPSTLKGIEEAIWFVLEQLPKASADAQELIGRLNTLVAHVDQILAETDVPGATRSFRDAADSLRGELAAARLPELRDDVSRAVREAEAAIALARKALRTLDAPDGSVYALLTRAEAAIAEVQALVRSVDAAWKRAEVPDAVAEARLAIGAWGQVARRSEGLAGDLQRTLAELDQALGAVRALALRLERDPGELLRGRGPDVVHPGAGR